MVATDRAVIVSLRREEEGLRARGAAAKIVSRPGTPTGRGSRLKLGPV